MSEAMSIELDGSGARAVRLALKQPGSTRTELAKTLGTSSQTAAALIKRLVDTKVLVESGATASTGGRPATKLFVSDRIGHCCSHQVIKGRLTSCAVDTSGSIFGRVDRPVKDIQSMLRGVGAAELELSVKAPDRSLLASGIIVPGIVDRATNTGEAPWLFGKDVIDPAALAPGSFVLSSASCLLSKQEASLGVQTGRPWLAVDMANSLSGLFLSRNGESIQLDLAHWEPDPAIVLVEALDEAILRSAGSRSSHLSRKLAVSSPREALASALDENDHVACTLVDRLVIETIDFVRNTARTLRPKGLILASNLLDPILRLADPIMNGLVRQAGMKPDSVVLISPQDVLEQRFVGACCEALDLRLGEVERSGEALKVE